MFGCMGGESDKVMNPPLGEVRITFQDWMGEVEFCPRCEAFGPLECVLKSEEVACAFVTAAMENEKWLFFPIYMRVRVIHVGVGAVASRRK